MIVSRASADQIIASALFVAITLALTAPKAAPIAITLLAIIGIGLALIEGFRFRDKIRLNSLHAAVVTLLGFTAASLLWAPDAADAFPHVAFATFVILTAFFLNVWIGEQDRDRLQLLSRAALAAVALGSLYLTIEIIWHQSLLHWLVQAGYFHTQGARPKNYLSELNRNFAVLNMLVWPALFFVSTLSWPAIWRVVCAGGLLLVVGAITLKSAHETSKLAFIAGAIVLGVGLAGAQMARRLVVATWILALLLSPPLSWYAYNGLALQDAKWLQVSARRRVVIWADYHHRVLESPIWGAGVRAGDALNRQGVLANVTDDIVKAKEVSRHPHNVFLQVWYELGVIGAMLALVIGTQVSTRLAQRTSQASPYVMATLMATIFILGLCWDLWQTWFIAAFGIVAVVAKLAAARGRLADDGA